MTARELVIRALSGRSTPRPAVGPLATFFCAADAGVGLEDFTLSADVQVDCLLRYHEKYRPDAVWIATDTWITAEAMGAPVKRVGKNQPLGGPPQGFISSARDLDRIPPPDPYAQGRQPLMLEVLSRVVERIGAEVFTVGCFDQSPFSLACQALGMTAMMTKIMDDRPLVDAVMEKSLDHALAYAEAMAACGADMLSTGDSPAGLLGRKHYVSVAFPMERRLFERLRSSTEKLLSLHICGDTSDILADMAESGAHVLEIDHHVRIDDAMNAVGDRVALWGNLDPVTVLLQGGREDVAASVTRILSAVRDAGGSRFVLSSGCILAPGSPAENIHALIESSHKF